MVGLPETICGQDVDVLFKYRTPVVVQIRDRRLGLLNWTFLLATLSYVLVYQILYNTGYLLVTTPVGGHRFSLREPTNELGCDPLDDEGCFGLFPNLNEVEYCLQNNSTGDGCGPSSFRTSDGVACAKRRKCLYADDLDVSRIEGNELLVGTRFSKFAQVNSCKQTEANSNTCSALWETVPGSYQDTFVGGIENYTLLIDHAMKDSGGNEDLAGVARKMSGVLSIPNNDALCKSFAEQGRRVTSDKNLKDATSKAPCFVESALAEAAGYDVFTLKEWLAAGNLDLDDWSGDENHPDESVRGRGHVVTIEIFYTNIVPWLGASDDIKYTFTVSHLPESSFKLTDSMNVIEANTTAIPARTVEKLYGLKIVVLVSGRLGVFDFNTLLLQLAAGSALLGIAALLTDCLALYVLPEKHLYAEAKVKQTEDFGDLRLRYRKETPDNQGGTSMAKQVELAEGDGQESHPSFLTTDDGKNTIAQA